MGFTYIECPVNTLHPQDNDMGRRERKKRNGIRIIWTNKRITRVQMKHHAWIS